MTRHDITETTRRTVLRRAATVLGIGVVGSAAASGTAAAGIGDGRVGHYHLNNDRPRGTVHDASPYGNDGWNNGATVVRGGGRVGNAFAFDGHDAHVEVPHHPSLDVGDAVTVAFWFKLTGQSSDNQYPRAVSKGQSTTTNGAYGVFIEDAGGDPTRIGLRFIDTDGTKHDVGGGNVLPNYDDGAWHHVAATYADADDVGTLWLDGRMHVERTIPGDVTIRSTDDPLHLGDGNDARHLNGMLDEVRIYDRALSAEEVRALAAMGGGRGPH